MGAHFDQAAGGELTDSLAHRRARHAEAARQLGLVETRARGDEAAHDIVGKREPQFVRQGAAAATDRRRRARGSGALDERHREDPAGSADGSASIMLTCAATMRQPSANRIQVCI